MSIIRVGELAGYRERDSNSEEVTYRRTWSVLTDNRYDGAKLVSYAPTIPGVGAIYQTETEVDPTCRVVNRRCQVVTGQPKLWTVELTYSNKSDDPEKNDENQEDPLNERPDVSWESEHFRRPATGAYTELSLSPMKAGFGKGIVTSAGEPFNPPPEIDDSRPVVVVTRNELTFFPSLVVQYQNAMNLDPFVGCEPKQAMIKSITARRRYEKNKSFWAVTYRIVFNRDKWDLELLDQGSWYLDGTNGNKKTQFMTELTADSAPQPRLGLLDGAGDKLHAADDPVFLSFEVYRKLPFAVLRLEQDILRG